MSTLNSNISSKASSSLRKIGRYFIDHYEEMLTMIFFIGAATMAVLTSLGIVVIAI